MQLAPKSLASHSETNKVLRNPGVVNIRGNQPGSCTVSETMFLEPMAGLQNLPKCRHPRSVRVNTSRKPTPKLSFRASANYFILRKCSGTAIFLAALCAMSVKAAYSDKTEPPQSLHSKQIQEILDSIDPDGQATPREVASVVGDYVPQLAITEGPARVTGGFEEVQKVPRWIERAWQSKPKFRVSGGHKQKGTWVRRCFVRSKSQRDPVAIIRIDKTPMGFVHTNTDSDKWGYWAIVCHHNKNEPKILYAHNDISSRLKERSLPQYWTCELPRNDTIREKYLGKDHEITVKANFSFKQ